MTKEMVDYIITAILIVLIGLACRNMWKAKKKGRRCMGCPESGNAICHCNKKE